MMTLKDFLNQYIEANQSIYPEIKEVYTEYDSGIDKECFMILEEEEASNITAGQCAYTGISQICDIGIILLNGGKTEAEAESLVEDIASRFLTTLRADFTLNGQLISGKIEKTENNSFNHFGKKGRSFMLRFAGKYWSVP
jgi:hypothetical protein